MHYNESAGGSEKMFNLVKETQSIEKRLKDIDHELKKFYAKKTKFLASLLSTPLRKFIYGK